MNRTGGVDVRVTVPTREQIENKDMKEKENSQRRRHQIADSFITQEILLWMNPEFNIMLPNFGIE